MTMSAPDAEKPEYTDPRVKPAKCAWCHEIIGSNFVRADFWSFKTMEDKTVFFYFCMPEHRARFSDLYHYDQRDKYA